MARVGFTFLALLAVHVLSFVVLMPSFLLLNWVGENGWVGWGIRVVASSLVLVIAFMGAYVITDTKTWRSQMVVSIVMAAAYGLIIFTLPDFVRSHFGRTTPLIIPRAGWIDASPDAVTFIAAAIDNPAVALFFLFGVRAFNAHKRKERERDEEIARLMASTQLTR